MIIEGNLPRFMALSESNLFWIADGSKIYKSSKTDVSKAVEFHEEVGTFIGLKLFSEEAQRPSETNPCNAQDNKCSHFCIKDSKTTAKCACPYMMALGDDGKTCTGLKTAILTVNYIEENTLLNNGIEEKQPCHCGVIMGYDVASPYKNALPVTIYETFSKVMDVDTGEGVLYFTSNKSTIATFNLPTEEIKPKDLRSEPRKPMSIISFGKSSVNGLAIDSLSRNLYVTLLTKTGAEIHVVNLRNTDCRRTILPLKSAAQLRNPSYLTLDPSHGKMYWIDEGFWPYTVNSANMDGTGKMEFGIEDSLRNSPHSLTADSVGNSLYWVDIARNVIGYNLKTGEAKIKMYNQSGPAAARNGTLFFYNRKNHDLALLESQTKDVIVIRANANLQRLFLYNPPGPTESSVRSCMSAPLCMAVPAGWSTCECDSDQGCSYESLPRAQNPAVAKVNFPRRTCKINMMFPDATTVDVKGCANGWLISAENETFENQNFKCRENRWSHRGKKVDEIRCTNMEHKNRQIAIGLGTALPLIIIVICLVLLMAYKRHWYMYRNLQRLSVKNIKLEEVLGSGNFGEIWLATLEKTKTTAVIKILKESATDREEKQFREEALLMSRFTSDYIIKTQGICLESRPIMLSLEYMNGGSVEKYLKRPEVRNCVTSADLLLIIQGIIHALKGCIYLETEGYIHRDLAARNCLVQVFNEQSNLRPKRVKLTDFGLAKDISSAKIYESRDPYANTLPIAWTAPEAFDGKFSPKSDVWAFGVLIWEVFTFGQIPFNGCPCSQPETCRIQALSNEQIEHTVCFEKKTLADYGKLCGSDFPEIVWSTMDACWCFEPGMRPGFQRLQKMISDVKSDICKAVFFRDLSAESEETATENDGSPYERKLNSYGDRIHSEETDSNPGNNVRRLSKAYEKSGSEKSLTPEIGGEISLRRLSGLSKAYDDKSGGEKTLSPDTYAEKIGPNRRPSKMSDGETVAERERLIPEKQDS